MDATLTRRIATLMKKLHKEGDTPSCVAVEDLCSEVERLRTALTRISHAKPDRLDHAQDILVLERCASIASKAIAGKG